MTIDKKDIKKYPRVLEVKYPELYLAYKKSKLLNKGKVKK